MADPTPEQIAAAQAALASVGKTSTSAFNKAVVGALALILTIVVATYVAVLGLPGGSGGGPPVTTTAPATSVPPTLPPTTRPPVTSTSTPAPTTTVPAPPGSRQAVLAWMGTVDLDTLGPSGITTLRANGLAGAVVMLGTCSSNPVPAWQITEWKWISSQGDLYVGCYIAAPHPATSTQERTDQKAALTVVATAAKSAGAKGFALDAEPYGGGDLAWNGISGLKAYAQSLVPAIGFGQIQVYPSSNASWPGSYNDLVRTQNGEPGTYSTNGFGDFIDGLLAGGAKVNVTDAAFHWGPQVSGDSWQTGTARSVALAKQRFPSANFSASIMFWPDNDEGHGAFSPSEIQYAVDQSTRASTGPIFMYQHTLAGLSGVWPQWLAAVKAGVSG